MATAEHGGLRIPAGASLKQFYERAGKLREVALPYIHELTDWTPSPILAEALDDKLKELGMKPGSLQTQLRQMAKVGLIKSKRTGQAMSYKGRGGALPKLPPATQYWTKNVKVKQPNGQDDEMVAAAKARAKQAAKAKDATRKKQERAAAKAAKQPAKMAQEIRAAVDRSIEVYTEKRPAKYRTTVERVPNGGVEVVINGSVLCLDQGCHLDITREANGVMRVVVS